MNLLCPEHSLTNICEICLPSTSFIIKRPYHSLLPQINTKMGELIISVVVSPRLPPYRIRISFAFHNSIVVVVLRTRTTTHPLKYNPYELHSSINIMCVNTEGFCVDNKYFVSIIQYSDYYLNLNIYI